MMHYFPPEEITTQKHNQSTPAKTQCSNPTHHSSFRLFPNPAQRVVPITAATPSYAFFSAAAVDASS